MTHDIVQAGGYSATISAPPPIPDETTRYLSAAVHRDPSFGAELYAEFLTSPYRSIPPSPGINAQAVLREAAAAVTRRQIRDWVLLGLMLLVFFSGPMFTLIWLGASLIGWALANKVRKSQPPLFWLGVFLVGPLVLLGLVWLLGVAALDFILGGPIGLSPSPMSLFLVLVVYGVLLCDRWVVWALVTKSFGYRKFSPYPSAQAWPGEQTARTIGSARFADRLAQIGSHSEHGNVIVYRGRDPFVGAGERLRSWSMAIPLQNASRTPANDGRHAVSGPGVTPGRTQRFTPSEMHAYLAQRFEALRSSESLSPSGRLRWLVQLPMVIAPAAEMLLHLDFPPTREVLPQIGYRPASVLHPGLLATVADHPLEWLRHYSCVRVESWDRELVVSAFLHLGCDDRMLYIEWNSFVLRPIRLKYRLVDLEPSHPGAAVWRATKDLATLPLSIPSRLRSLRPPGGSPGKYTQYHPASYGSVYSIRELAAEASTANYFQDGDVERYQKIIERHTVAGIIGFLDAKGLSSVEFAQRAATIINNSLVNNGTMSGPIAQGKDDVSSTSTGTPGTAAP